MKYTMDNLVDWVSTLVLGLCSEDSGRIVALGIYSDIGNLSLVCSFFNNYYYNVQPSA